MPIYNVHPIQLAGASAPDLLQVQGLLLHAEVNVTDALGQALISQNQPIPTAATGRALVDTGASVCAIDEAAALRLGLQPVGQMNVSGIAGSRIHNVYVAKVTFPGTPIPALDLTLAGSDLAGQQLLLLIGRDILRSCVLIYNGPLGCYTLAF
jgi:predicted aspartyl protease